MIFALHPVPPVRLVADGRSPRERRASRLLLSFRFMWPMLSQLRRQLLHGVMQNVPDIPNGQTGDLADLGVGLVLVDLEDDQLLFAEAQGLDRLRRPVGLLADPASRPPLGGGELLALAACGDGEGGGGPPSGDGPPRSCVPRSRASSTAWAPA